MEAPGVSVNYWWFGQVVDEIHWQNPTLGKLHRPSELKGENYTYNVRIIGRHDPDKIIPDSQLFTASVLLPTTAGSGSGGSVQTPNIRQGAFVSGFYKDGKDGNEPIIAFVLPNNSQTELLLGDPDKGFVPRSGFAGQTGQKPVSTSDINIPQSPGTICEGTAPNNACVGNRDQTVDGNRFFYIPKTKKCEGPSGSLQGVQKAIGDSISILNLIRSGVGGSISDLQGLIQNQLTFYQEQLQALVKSLIDYIRNYVVNKINNGFNGLMENLEPSLRVSFSNKFEKVSDILLCLFQKIINNLKDLVKDLFQQILDKYISAPFCAAEAFIANLISSVFNELSEGINSAISALGLDNITGSIFSALSTIVGVLKFLTCEEDLRCDMPEEWSIFSGVRRFTESPQAGIESRVSGITSSLLKGDTPIACNTSQLPCGPPTVSFIGNGFGASANPIISATGSIIGFDILNPGSGYSSPPRVQITDVCGNGSGASAITIINEGKVEKVVSLDSGVGYLQYPDGSTGSNGTQFSSPSDTIIIDRNDTYSVYPPETFVNVNEGDQIYLKNGAQVEIYSQDGEVLQTLFGRGQVSPIEIEFTGTLTTPEFEISTNSTGNEPSSDNQYPVILELDDIALTNSGTGYSPEDEIVITPSNGAEAKVTFDDNGSVKDIIVTNKGTGFNEMPKITIKSSTGFNANMLPVFNVVRIGNINERDFEIPQGATVINVVDCVGIVQK